MNQPTASQRPDEALRSLPLLAVPDDIWLAVAKRTRPSAPTRRGWLAAAAVMVGAVSALLLVARGQPQGEAINVLMAQSQQIERRLAAPSAARVGRAALVYGIAELDRELAPLCIEPARDPGRAEQLWRTRVRLLESLAELDRAGATQSGLSI